jgi:Lipid A 3-O-deacylase (PagL)
MKKFLFSILALLLVFTGNTQDSRVQYPLLLQKAFFGIDVGGIYYPFSNKSLPQGYQAKSIQIPAAAPRLTLLGYHLNKNLSARITYMRPVQWVVFKNVNGDQLKHSVWMNVGGLTIKENIPLSSRFFVFGETGLALITRNGFHINGYPVIRDGSFSTISVGGGLEYHVNSKWDLTLYSAYSPGKANIKQPHTLFTGAGFSYNMHPLSKETIATMNNEGMFFPEQVIQFAFTTNAFGYGVNHFFAEGKVPVFWGGLAEVEQGLAVNYTRNVFHSKKTFSLDIGTSFGSWESKVKDQSFQAISIYPLMRFTFLRNRISSSYFFYSVAGPTFLSKTNIDSQNTGRHFTFRDFMGVGSYIGHHKCVNVEMNIGHFSNGNLFPNNGAVKIPLSFVLGYSF